MMSLIRIIIESLFAHFYLVSFIAGILGEEAVLFLAFLADGSIRNLLTILILAPFGILLVDIAYFHLGRIGLMRRASEKIKNIKNNRGILSWIIKFSEKQFLLALIFTKFISGTRVALMIYSNARGMKLKKFIIYNFVAIEIWAMVMIPLAWLAGRGLTRGLHWVKDFTLIIGIALLFVVCWDLVGRLAGYLVLRKMKVKQINSI